MGLPLYKGSAIPVLTLKPNEDYRVYFGETDATQIYEGLDTSEERLGTQPRALYSLRYTGYALDGEGTAYFKKVLDLARALPVAVPLWISGIKLTADALPDATTLYVDDTQFSHWEVAYDYAIIFHDYKTWEVIEVDEVDTLELTLSSPLVGLWAAGTKIFPLMVGKLARDPHTQLTDDHGVLEVDFEERWLPGISHDRLETFYEAEPPEMTMASCGEDFTFAWLGTDEPNIIQIAEQKEGPWFDYFEFLPTDEQFVSKEYEVTINNSFYGARWFRIIEETGRIIAAPINPPAAELPMPELTLSGADISTRGLNPPKVRPGQPQNEIETRPYSWRENVFINRYNIYAQVSERWEMFRGYNTWLDQVVTANAPDGESVVKWTRDGTDPTEDTVNPTINGVENNAAAFRTDFGGIIKARCFNGSCRSPLLTIILDKRVEALQRLKVFISGGSATVACDLPWVDAFGNTIRSSNSCPEPDAALFDFEACDQAYANAGTGTRERTFHLRTFSSENRFLSGWEQYVPSSSKYSPADATITRYPANFWDKAPVLFTNIIFADSAGHDGYFVGGFMTGPSGSTALAEAGITSLMSAISAATPDDCRLANSEIAVSVMDVLLTPHDDFGTLVPVEGGDYEGDPTPPPPTPSGVYGDDFESQPEGEIDETPSTYYGGTGFAGPWFFETFVAASGGDDFQGYTPGTITDYFVPEEGEEAPPSYNLGEGFAGPWRFETAPDAVYGGDDFQSYEDGELVDSGDNLTSTPPMNGGTGFAGPWLFMFRALDGGDDFQSYEDGTIDEINDVLNEGNGFAGPWIITTFP